VPTKSLGQNFLHDQNLAHTIVSHLDIQPGDHIVEIGPGLGALTGLLADAATRLTVIEKDARLVPHLQSVFTASHISIHHMDALDFDLRSLWGYGPVKVVGNLPYYISSPLIAKYSSALSPASMLVLTLQLELAQRLGAIVVLKGSGTVTSDGLRAWRCARGGASLATGGSGDVLAGVVGAMFAQFGAQVPAGALAALAVEVHARAGDLWASRHGDGGALAREIADLVPDAMMEMRRA
jgi:hypothetical protein